MDKIFYLISRNYYVWLCFVYFLMFYLVSVMGISFLIKNIFYQTILDIKNYCCNDLLIKDINRKLFNKVKEQYESN